MGKIAPCTCKSEFQDKEFGPGKRYFNTKSSGSKQGLKVTGFRCTVCKKEIPATAEESKVIKKEK